MFNDCHALTAIQSAYRISKQCLVAAYKDTGIQAGETHFSDVWIRDSCFAGWGAICLGDTAIVQQFLLHALAHMTPEGQCPLRIGQRYFMLKFMGITGPTGPTYIDDKYTSIPMDSNALLIILAGQLVAETNDGAFARQVIQSLTLACDWYDAFMPLGLVIEGPYAGWADSIKKQGHVLYTNVLVYAAYQQLSALYDGMGESEMAAIYRDKQLKFKQTINHFFWNGAYYDDWIHTGVHQSTFSVDGNMLAILFGVASKDQAAAIFDMMDETSMIGRHGLPVVYGRYTKRQVYPPFLAIGLHDYHNGLIWFWVSCIAAVAHSLHGRNAAVMRLMTIMANAIIQYGTVYEVYTKKGAPVRRLFYSSEKGFAWSAGLFVWATHRLNLHKM